MPNGLLRFRKPPTAPVNRVRARHLGPPVG